MSTDDIDKKIKFMYIYLSIYSEQQKSIEIHTTLHQTDKIFNVFSKRQVAISSRSET